MDKNNLLVLSIADPDYLIKYKRRDIINQDLDGFFEKVYYVFLFEQSHQKNIIIDKTYEALILSNKKYSWFEVGKFRFINLLVTYFFNIFYLARYVKKNKISIILSHDPLFRGLIAYFISKLTGVPYMVEVWSNYKQIHWNEGRTILHIFHSVKLEIWLTNFILKHAKAVIADRNNYWYDNVIPHAVKDRYFRYHFSLEEAHYKPLGERINYKKDYNATNKKVVMYLGRLVSEKRAEDLVPFANELFNNSEIKDVEMWIVGDGPLKKRLINEIKEYGLSDKVRFIEGQPTSKVADFLYTADVVVAPHAGWVIPESQLAETPIIVYDFDWHREGVADGKYGILVPYRDTKAMAVAAKDVLLYPEKYKSMVKQAREWILQNNTIEQEMKDKLQIYQTVLGD